MEWFFFFMLGFGATRAQVANAMTKRVRRAAYVAVMRKLLHAIYGMLRHAVKCCLTQQQQSSARVAHDRAAWAGCTRKAASG